MTPTRHLAPLAAILVCSLAATSCAHVTAGGVIQEAKDITADCAKAATGGLVAQEITPIVTDLTSLDFNQVQADVDSEVQKLTAGGLALQTAWQVAACVIGKAVSDALHDATTGDSLAARRAYNGKLWLEGHRVTFVGAGPLDAAGRRATSPPPDGGTSHQAWPLQ